MDRTHDRASRPGHTLTAVTAAGIAIVALFALPLRPPPAAGQTIPLRPTPTAQAGAFGVLIQPTPPVPAAPPAAPTRAATQPAAEAATPRPATPTTPAASLTPTSPVTSSPALASATQLRVEHVNLAAERLPAPPAGWRLGETALRVGGVPAPGPAGSVTVAASARDLAAAGGVRSGLVLFALTPEHGWAPIPGQSLDQAADRISFAPGAAGVYAVLARVPLAGDSDYAIPGGRFFRGAGGTRERSGALAVQSEGGFSVVDGTGGARASFWSVYTAVGGEAVLGRPVSRRFLAGSQLVQVFERGTIVSDSHTAATARAGASTITIPPGALEPEPPPLPA